MSVHWSELRKVLDSHQQFLLTSHIRPDCDALGSELGMAGLLRAMGKDVRIVNGMQTPPNLAFIDPDQQIQTLHEDVPIEELSDIDLLMVLDTSAWAQLGPMGDVLKTTAARKIVVDHHVGEDDLGADFFKDSTADSTGSLVVAAAAEFQIPLTPEMAMPLYAAIATDTGWFRFPSTDAGTYQRAARLVEAGAVPSAIYNSLYEQDSEARFKLRGRITGRTQVEMDGRLAHTAALREDFEVTGALPSDTEDVINLTLTIRGVEVAVILVQLPDEDRFKISFRSRCAIDCSQLANTFGGGGHKAAAGAAIDGPYEEALEKVLDVVRAAMR